MNSKLDLLPTGTCFDDPLDAIEAGQIPLSDVPKIRIVHGLVSRQNDPSERIYAHCWWVLRGRIHDCWFHPLKNGRHVMIYTPEEFQSVFKVHDQTVYTVAQIMIEGLKHPRQHAGPFKQQYLEACRDYKAEKDKA